MSSVASSVAIWYHLMLLMVIALLLPDLICCYLITFDVIWCLMIPSDWLLYLFKSIHNYHAICCHLITSDVMWCYLISCDVFWCPMMSSDVIWCHLMSSDVIWCHLMSYVVIWCHLMTYNAWYCKFQTFSWLTDRQTHRLTDRQ